VCTSKFRSALPEKVCKRRTIVRDSSSLVNSVAGLLAVYTKANIDRRTLLGTLALPMGHRKIYPSCAFLERPNAMARPLCRLLTQVLVLNLARALGWCDEPLSSLHRDVKSVFPCSLLQSELLSLPGV